MLYDYPSNNVYRVNVSGYDNRTESAFYARLNVKASSPTSASNWVCTYTHEAGLPPHTTLEVTHAYKLRKVPVWLRKIGKYNYRFSTVQLIKWKASH